MASYGPAVFVHPFIPFVTENLLAGPHKYFALH